MYRLLTYHEERDMFAFFFSFIKRSRPRYFFSFISLFFRTVAIDCQPPTEITHFSLVDYDELHTERLTQERKIIHKKNAIEEISNGWLLSLDERRSERKLRNFSLSSFLAYHSRLKRVKESKRERENWNIVELFCYINYSLSYSLDLFHLSQV